MEIDSTLLIAASVLIPVMVCYAVVYAFLRGTIGLLYTWQRFLAGFVIVWLCSTFGLMIDISYEPASWPPTMISLFWSVVVLLALLVWQEHQLPPKVGGESSESTTDSTVSPSQNPENAGHDDSEHSPAHSTEAIDPQQSHSEEQAYEIAWSELESDQMKKGVWAKCFADADGDENKSRAAYIRTRAAEILARIPEGQ